MEPTSTKAELARELLLRLFAGSTRISTVAAVEEGARLGISRRTIARSAKSLGATFVSNGPNPGFWELNK